MSEFINTIDLLGDDVVLESMVRRTITEFKDNVVTSIGAYAFYQCTQLTTVDLPAVTSISSFAFRFCTSLTALILRNSMIVTLSNVSDISDTPICTGAGYIYVPASLKEQYINASNWSNFSTQFRSLEDYTVDGTITGELDWDKINAAA